MTNYHSGQAGIIFLDRDNTISHDPGYTIKPEDMRIFPGAGKALGELKRQGFKLVVVTNQSAVARGYGTLADVERTNAEMQRQLLSEDPEAQIDLLRLCPHHPDDNCLCRKPKTGLISNDFPWEFELSACWMLGDQMSDINFGRNLGLPLKQCVRIQREAETQEARQEDKPSVSAAEESPPVVRSLEEFVRLVIGK